jgi:hypothetical protein
MSLEKDKMIEALVIFELRKLNFKGTFPHFGWQIKCHNFSIRQVCN